MRTSIITMVLLLAASANAAGQNTSAQSPRQPASPKPNSASPSDVDNAGPIGSPCVFDFERGEVPNCVRESVTGALFIPQDLLKGLRFDSYGLVAVLSPERGWMYVNRKGNVVVSGVPVIDNWADSFHDGLVRIVRDKKYGFADRKGRIVIPAIYDGALNFEKGRATVCKSCESKCADRECEHHFFSGGEWFRINTKGAVLMRLHPDTR